MPSTNLTTRYLFKLHAGVSGTGDDTLIDRLIEQACQQVVRRCDRVFQLTTYKSWLDGNGCRRMHLPQWPVVSLYRVNTQTDDVIDIEYVSTGLHADVSFDGTTLRLHSIDAAGTEATDETITAAGNKLISDLAAAITALTGWTATAEAGYEGQATQLIKPVDGLWALASDYATLEVPDIDDGEDCQLVSETDRMIEYVMGGRQFGDTTPRLSVFPTGKRNVFVWYRAGYTYPVDNGDSTAIATEGNVPKGLTLVCNQIVNDVYKTRRRDGTLKSEKLGDYSYTLADMEGAIVQAIDSHWSSLLMYARREF